MAKLDALKAKLSEYETAYADTETKRLKRDEDRATADAAFEQADASWNAWRASLEALHRLDDEFDALSQAHEPPELPAVG